MKISKVNRIVRLLTTLQSGRKYKVEELMESLDVSRRTVFRDLNELSAIGVPYYYDSKSGGYSIEQSYYLQPIDLKVHEALSLLMLVHKARKMMPFPFHRSALMAGLKIENNLPPPVKEYCETSLGNVSFKKGRASECSELETKFCDIQKCIREKRGFEMVYKSLYDDGNIEVSIYPYHLIFNHRAWYVIGYSKMHREIRTFKLSRIRHYNISEERFEEPKNFSVTEYFGRAWSMIPEGRLWNVKLSFDPMVANNVSEVNWHPTQKVQWNIDGSVDMEFRVDGLGEISWWILGYGDKVKVLKPAKLREKLLAISKSMVDNYKD